MTNDPLEQFIEDTRDIFVFTSRIDAVSREPYSQPKVRRRYPFILFTFKPEYQAMKDKVWERFLDNPYGTLLMDQLAKIFYDPTTRNFRSTIHVNIVDDRSGDPFAGEVTPETRYAPDYYIEVELRRKMEGPIAKTRGEAMAIGGGFIATESWWPAEFNPQTGEKLSCAIRFHYTDPISAMAETLHHELLHVWYFHEGVPKRYRTGHGNREQVMQCGIEDDFLDRIRLFINKLNELEK